MTIIDAAPEADIEISWERDGNVYKIAGRARDIRIEEEIPDSWDLLSMYLGPPQVTLNATFSGVGDNYYTLSSTTKPKRASKHFEVL